MPETKEKDIVKAAKKALSDALAALEKEAKKAKLTADEILEEKKKIRNNFFIYTYIAVKNQKKEEQDLENFKKSIDVFFSEEKKKNNEFASMVRECVQAVRHTEAVRESLLSFFNFDKDPEADKIRESLKAVGMTEDEFKFAAFAATGEDMEELSRYFSRTAAASLKEKELRQELNQDEKKARKDLLKDIERLKKQNKQQMAATDRIVAGVKNTDVTKFERIRDKGILKARQSLYQYALGNAREMGQLLGNSIKKACEKFGRERDMDTSMQWSMYAEEMLKLMDRHPKLMKEAGLSEEQLHAARSVAEMGRNIREGLVALEKMAEASLDTKHQLSPEENEKLLGKIVTMSAAYSARENVIAELAPLTPEKKCELGDGSPVHI